MRRLLDRSFKIITGICAGIGCGIFFAITFAIAWRGIRAVNWQFLSQEIQNVGASGGIFYNLVGTAILIVTALIVCVPLALALGIMVGVYLRQSRWREPWYAVLQLINGMPSILFGLFGLVVFVKFFGLGKSWLNGGVLLGLLILPTVTVAFIEQIRNVPREYEEAATGLGMTRSQIIWSVIVPRSLNGLITGSLLGLVRAAGETAPIMFTAAIFAGATFPDGIAENPVLSLPYHIFILAQDSFNPEAGEKLWGTALVLLGFVVTLSLAALPARLKIHEEARNH